MMHSCYDVEAFESLISSWLGILCLFWMKGGIDGTTCLLMNSEIICLTFGKLSLAKTKNLADFSMEICGRDGSSAAHACFSAIIECIKFVRRLRNDGNQRHLLRTICRSCWCPQGTRRKSVIFGVGVGGEKCIPVLVHCCDFIYMT